MPCEEAVELATHAVEADIAGDVAKAIEFYTRAADALDRAASVTPAEAAEMRGKSSEYRNRAGVLQGKLQASQLEAMAQSAQMAQQGAQLAGQTNAAVKTAGGYGTVAGAAAVGAVAGAVVLGPMTAVVAAGGAAYATTRKDTVGDVARQTGQAAGGRWALRAHGRHPNAPRALRRGAPAARVSAVQARPHRFLFARRPFAEQGQGQARASLRQRGDMQRRDSRGRVVRAIRVRPE
mmetsp:Transcript_1722/g.6938  ORF Transcript_1722/g.6938 Transcript_1722/m.6938 type:complete len:236 (+) Transcript_1722:111-818(+)